MDDEVSRALSDEHLTSTDATEIPGRAPSTEVDAEPNGVAAEIGDWARTLHEESAEIVLRALISEAITHIEGTDYASLSLVNERHRIETRVPSHEIPKYLDAVQMELGEGPCLDSIHLHRIVRVPDMGAETPWPSFASRAFDSGIRSMVAFQLFIENDSLGALNLYSRKRHAFTEKSEDVGWGLAAHAALALANAQTRGHFHEAVASRDLIGQAKGIIMERYRLTEHEAFLLLVEVSSRTNRKLRKVAEEFVRTGLLPDIHVG